VKFNLICLISTIQVAIMPPFCYLNSNEVQLNGNSKGLHYSFLNNAQRCWRLCDPKHKECKVNLNRTWGLIGQWVMQACFEQTDYRGEALKSGQT